LPRKITIALPHAIFEGRHKAYLEVHWQGTTMEIKPGGRNGWFCFARSSSPVVGMAGFANHNTG
jgi:hypothetical protein